MLDQLGLSFLPTGNASARGGEAGPAGGRLEDVLRILSLRMPKFAGAGAIAPDALLNSPGGAGLPSGGGTGGDPLADAIARTVLGNLPGGGTTPGAPGAADPTGSFGPGMPPPGGTQPKPRIIPIEDPPPGRGGTANDPNALPPAMDPTDPFRRRDPRGGRNPLNLF